MAGTEITEARSALLSQCEEEIRRLTQFFHEDVKIQIAVKLGRDTSGSVAQRKKVAAYMDDSAHPFSILVQEIMQRMTGDGDQVTMASVKDLVLEIGLRVCFGLPKVDADPLEDVSEGSLRRWEVREVKMLPPGIREVASERRRRRRKITERLTCLNNAVEILRDEAQFGDGDAMLKAREFLSKTEDEAALREAKLEWLLKRTSPPLQAHHPDNTTGGSLCDSTNVAQENRKRRQSDPLEKEKLKLEKLLKRQRTEEQREQKRKEKEDNEEKKQEKVAEREQRRKEKDEAERRKDVEREQKRKEREQGEKRKEMAIKKQASFMNRFLQACKKENKDLSSEESSPEQVARKEGKSSCASATQDLQRIDVVATMDAVLREAKDYDLDDLKREYISSWRKVRKEFSSVTCPTWGARRKPKAPICREIRLHGVSCSPDASYQTPSKLELSPTGPCMEAETEVRDASWKDDSGTESAPSTPGSEVKKVSSDKYQLLRSKKKKLLQFDKSHRPPYYGTYSRKSSAVKPHKPLKKDPGLDYEVDSDAEWEEEEPGECLSDFDMDKDEEDDRLENEDDEDSSDEFMVPDGYLSEDEGVHMEGGTKEEGAESQAFERSASATQSCSDACISGVSREHLRKVLDKVTEQSLRANRPLIINNLNREFEGDKSSVCGSSRVETLILEALRMEVINLTTIGVS